MNVKTFLKKSKATIAVPWKAFQHKTPLLAFITGRIITMLFLLFLLGFALFGLMELAPGDIVDQMMTQQLLSSTEGGNKGSSPVGAGGVGEDKVFSQTQMETLRAEFGLDQPFYIQYFKWLNRVFVHHDLGVSLISRAPVSFLIRSRLWNSVLLNLISLIFITTFSFLLGVYFSSKAGTKIDVAATFPSLNKISVGIDITLYLSAIVSASSVFTLQIFTSVTSSAISSIIGESILQGPHHGAQKSTNTGISEFNTSFSKFASVK